MTVDSTAGASVPALVLEDIWKTYPGVIAVKGVSLTAIRGEVHAIVGENGAGKSTLLAIAAGSVVPDSGFIAVDGEVSGHTSVQGMAKLGIGIAFQDGSLVPDLSVIDNLLLWSRNLPNLDESGIRSHLLKVFGRFGLPDPKHQLVRDLTPVIRQVAEIAKALLGNPKVLIFDEPTAALASEEVAALQSLIREAATLGACVVYVTHRLPEVLRFSDVLSVLRDGEVVAIRLESNALSEDDLIGLMAGQKVESIFPEKGDKTTDLRMVASLRHDANGASSVELRRGEIIGLTGMEGEGHKQWARALGGIEDRKMSVDSGVGLRPINSVRDAREEGIVFVSGDRLRESLFMAHSVGRNLTMSALESVSRFGWIDYESEDQSAESMLQEMDIKADTPRSPIGALSGGNQQKVVLARALSEEPKLLILEEPTQGVDARTRNDIYQLVRRLAGTGVTVAVVSSDAIELAGLSDRVLVFVRGQIAAELAGVDLTEESLIGASATSDRDRERLDRRNVPTLIQWLRGTGDATGVVLLLATIVLVGAFAAFSQPLFLTTQNIANLAFLAVPLGFAALAQTTVLVGAGIDLSVGPSIALVTVAVAQIMERLVATSGLAIAIPIAIACGVAVGVVNGTLIVRMRIEPLLATLATYVLVQGLTLLWSPVTGGFVPREFLDFARIRLVGLPWPFWLLVLATVGMEVAYRRSSHGLKLRALGSSPTSARRLGVQVQKVQFLSYVLAGFFAAMAGVFFTATIGVGDPQLGVTLTLASITAAVLGGVSVWGGRGSYVGAFLGAFTLAMIANMSAFLNFPAEVQLYVRGGLVILGIALYSWIQGGEIGSATRELT